MKRKIRHASFVASTQTVQSNSKTVPPSGSATTAIQEVLVDYRNHLEKVQGLSPRTCDKYLYFAGRMLESQITASGFTWSAVTADTLRKFVERDASARKGFGAHGTATSVRSFLRFLVSNGLIASGLELAIPQIRRNVVDNLAQMLISLK